MSGPSLRDDVLTVRDSQVPEHHILMDCMIDFRCLSQTLSFQAYGLSDVLPCLRSLIRLPLI